MLFLLAFTSRADTYLVTRRVDDTNPGSLRWAILSANSNTPSAAPDSILFNLPNATTTAQRTILLNTELPVLTSNIVIDGTSQLSGPPVGTAGARIFLSPRIFDSCKRGLVIEDAENIEIYGLGFIRFINSDPTVTEEYSDGIYMRAVRNITIGAPDKGNTFIGCFYGIRHVGTLPRNPAVIFYGANITIQGNTMGPQPAVGSGTSARGLVNGISLFNVTNVKIGGWERGEENEIMAFLTGINISVRTRALNDRGDIIVVQNQIYPGKLPPTIPFTIPLSGITIVEADPDNIIVYPVVVSGNVLQNARMMITDFKAAMRIVNNELDCDYDTSQAHQNVGIWLSECDTAMIGGTDSANIIKNSAANGVLLLECKYITVSKNSIFCNEAQGINVFSTQVTVPRITDLLVDASGLITGKTCPGCKVEAFSTQQCQNLLYNGQNYRATITADATGDWSYNAPTNCNATFTTTDQEGTTSKFYAYVDFLFKGETVVLQNASCGRSNGSITGVVIYPGVSFYWEDDAGNVISRDTNLVNVPAGIYRLVCTKENVLCTKSWTFQLSDIQPAIDERNVVLRNPVPGCNILGAINGLTVSGGSPGFFRYQWFNAAGVQVGSGISLQNVPQGDYSIKVSVLFDTTCFVTAGPYMLRDVAAPVMDLTNVTITDATCAKANGSITGIRITDGAANPVYRWFNNNNTVAGTSADLLNVPPGKYYLHYDDASPCPPITSPVYNIGNNGLVEIDVSAMLVLPSGCTVVKGAIKNIVVTGANRIEWVALSTGLVIGTSPDLLNVPAGGYRLRAFDSQFGCADSTGIIEIPFTPVQPLAIVTKSVKDDFCTGANGFIRDMVFSPAPLGYTFKWVKNATDTFATTLNISGLSKGAYTLLAYDSNGCVQVAMQQVLNDHPSPVLDESGKQVKPDICTQQLGSIQQIAVSGGDAPLGFNWYTSPGNVVIGQTNALVKRGTGNYYLIVRDANGCADTSSVIFVADESPVIDPPQYDEVYVKRNTTGKFVPLNPATEGVYTFYDEGSSVPFFSNTTGIYVTPVLAADRIYYVRREVGSCVSVKARVKVNVIDFSKVFLPNSFTPNGDGTNDLFRIRVYGKIIIDQFVVYNRWGQAVFLTGDQRKGWDGTAKGQPQPADTYVWTVKGADIDGTPIFIRGIVVLVR